jgi:hypothetical protein
MLPAVLLMALGAWVFLAPLAGPYVGFGFDTTARWRFSQDHITLSLLPGFAIFAGGVLMTRRSRAAGWLAGLLAVAGGAWLAIGPWLHPVWSSATFGPLPGSEWKTALRWICDFSGAGVLAVYLGAQAQGMLERNVAPRAAATSPGRTAVVEDVATDEPVTTVERP